MTDEELLDRAETFAEGLKEFGLNGALMMAGHEHDIDGDKPYSYSFINYKCDYCGDEDDEDEEE